MNPLKPGTQNQVNNRLSPRTILLIYLAAGFYALILQTTLFRELLVVVLGNEFVLGISLFNWLIGIFLGAIAGGIFADRLRDQWKMLVLSFLLLILFSPLSVTLTRLLYPLSRTPPGSHIPFFQVFWLSGILIAPLSFFIGFTFPLAARFDTGQPENSAKKTIFMSRVYISEAGGSLLGGLLASFVLAGRFNSYLTLACASLPLLIFLASASLSIGRKKTALAVSIFLAFQIIWITPYGNSRFDGFMVKKRWQGFSGSELIWNHDSRFQNLAIGKNQEQFNLYTNGKFSTSFPEAADNLVLAAHLITQHPGPKKVLIIGEAITGLAERLLEFNIREITSLEIDKDLISGIKMHLPSGSESIFCDPRFSIQIEDGRKFASAKNRSHSGWDVVFLNVPEPSTLLLNRFYTREFFRDIASIQSENGILCLRTTSSENYLSGLVSQYTASIYQTLHDVFPHLAVAPGDKNIFFASKKDGIVSQSPDVLAERYIKSKARPEKLARIFRSLYPPEKTSFAVRALQAHPGASLNTDTRPISNFYFNKILGWTSDRKSEGFFLFFEKITLFQVFFFLFGIFCCRLVILEIKSLKKWVYLRKTGLSSELILGKHAPSRFPILFVVAATGFSGLSLELLIIYSFQHVFGYIYQLIGFIIALFMTGLPLGALFSSRLLTKKTFTEKKQIGLLASTQVLLAVVALVFPVLLEQAAVLELMGKGLIFLVMATVGALVGMVFPPALQLMAKGYSKNASRSAGIVDAFDHLGAAIGAVFCGALLLPILGTVGIARLIAVLSVFSLAYLLIQLASEVKPAG